MREARRTIQADEDRSGRRGRPALSPGEEGHELRVEDAVEEPADGRVDRYAPTGGEENPFGDFRIGYVHFGGEVANAELLSKLKALEQRLGAYDEIERVLGMANVDSVVGLIEKLGIRISPEMDVEDAFGRVRRSDRTSDYTIDMSFSEAFEYVVHARDERRGRSPGGIAGDGSAAAEPPVYDGLLLRYFVTGEESSRSLAAVAAIWKEIGKLGLDRIDGVEVRVGGGDVIYPLECVYYADTLARSFGYALAGNRVVLWVAWRRIGKALLATAPVVVAAMIVVGMMPVFDVPLNALNLGVSAILGGIGIDYPIHWIERYDEERAVRHDRARGDGAAPAGRHVDDRDRFLCCDGHAASDVDELRAHDGCGHRPRLCPHDVRAARARRRRR